MSRARLAGVGVASALSLSVVACGSARPYPYWGSPQPMSAKLDCAELEAWVCKSGKEGVGLMVALRSSGASTEAATCRVEVLAATVTVRGAAHPAARLPPAPELGPGAAVFLYVPVPFDNNAAWNEGAREGTLRLDVATRGQPSQPIALQWPIAQSVPGHDW